MMPVEYPYGGPVGSEAWEPTTKQDLRRFDQEPERNSNPRRLNAEHMECDDSQQARFTPSLLDARRMGIVNTILLLPGLRLSLIPNHGYSWPWFASGGSGHASVVRRPALRDARIRCPRRFRGGVRHEERGGDA